MKITVFWDAALCSLVELTYVSEVLTAYITTVLMLGAAGTSETSVSFYESTCHIPESL
jgi:hypothetical protein